ncbi:MAG: V-type ATP synthase subunit A [Lachnospiraceae bacterium]|jgi:V/A-type H+-transporting ATPase subunit A|nr:V-type ATP synthase subunit A [Lachnospiraceae bacterium]
MGKTTGKVAAVNGNMVVVEFDGAVMMNEVAYIETEGKRLKSEIIRIRGNRCSMQVFEITTGIMVGDNVDFTGEMLAIEVGPGLLAQIYDGLQNPLPRLAEKCGFFLERGEYLEPLPRDQKWDFTPKVAIGAEVSGGDAVGSVPEGIFDHLIMVPFHLTRTYTVKSIASEGAYTNQEVIAVLVDGKGDEYDIFLSFTWPVKRAVMSYEERLLPYEPMVTQYRIIDTFFSVAKGGTFCVPGPFGAGKTVIQQTISQNADVDIVIFAACGERAGEVVETLKEFPQLIDPATGRSLMERTIIICNTSSMPVAAREASLYTAVTIAEYYRQMGLHVLLLADSTSRWAQALREMSGRLEEIPGEEAFPAYLESTIAGFYERAGLVRMKNGSEGSVTIGGTVSPAGGNLEEPVTQATLKVVGAFHGLSRERSAARKYPAIHPLDSWTKYQGIIAKDQVDYAMGFLVRGTEIEQMMRVVGEEGTGLSDFIIYLKGNFVDAVYMQQDTYEAADKSVKPERQKHVLDLVISVLRANLDFDDMEEARSWFATLGRMVIDYNYTPWQSKECRALEKQILDVIEAKI